MIVLGSSIKMNMRNSN